MSIEEFSCSPLSINELKSPEWADLRFDRIQKLGTGPRAIFTKGDSSVEYYAYRWDVRSMLEIAERSGQSLPQVKLVQRKLNRAHTWNSIKNIFARTATLAGVVGGGIVAFIVAVNAVNLGLHRISSAVNDPRDDRELAAANPLVGQPDVSYNEETRAAYKKDSQKLLLKWTFNKEGKLHEACTVQIRQPDEPWGAWGRQKYTETCFTGDAIPSLLKPTFNLPQP